MSLNIVLRSHILLSKCSLRNFNVLGKRALCVDWADRHRSAVDDCTNRCCNIKTHRNKNSRPTFYSFICVLAVRVTSIHTIGRKVEIMLKILCYQLMLLCIFYYFILFLGILGDSNDEPGCLYGIKEQLRIVCMNGLIEGAGNWIDSVYEVLLIHTLMRSQIKFKDHSPMYHHIELSICRIVMRVSKNKYFLILADVCYPIKVYL